ncbi:MAG: Gx transporter family protein [Oscillospiraceae bacterium]
MPNKRHAAHRVAFLGVMLAMALALSWFESAVLPVLPMLSPGVKLGLSNIVTMYAVFFLGARDALTIAVLKSFFVFLTRGPTGAAMSLVGGLVSVAVMLVLLRLVPSLSSRFVSIAGAIGHNLGQLGMSVLILQSAYTLYYLPVMLLSGVVMGIVTGILLKLVMPYLRRMDGALK